MSSKHGFLGSSPSSDGAGTVNGTPETRLTPFSTVKSVNDKAAFLFNQAASGNASTKATPSLRVGDALDKDPFITPSIKALCEQSVLSPTASSFHPFSLRVSQTVDQTSVVVNSHGPTTVPFDVANKSMLTSPSPIIIGSISSIGSRNPEFTQSSSFSTDMCFITRALKVSGISHPVHNSLVQSSVQSICSNLKGTVNYFRSGSDLLVRLSDIMDSIAIYHGLKAIHPEWSVEYISPATFSEEVIPGAPFASAHEGQVSFVASFAPNGGIDRLKLEFIILDLLSIDGVLYAYQKQLATEAGTTRLIAEYSDINSAASAVERLNGATIRGINISITFHKPDMPVSLRHRGYPNTPTRGGLKYAELTSAMNSMSVSSPGRTAVHTISPRYSSVLSPTGRSFIPTSYRTPHGMSTVPATFNGQFRVANSSFLGFDMPTQQSGQTYHNTHFGAYSHSHNHGHITQVEVWDEADQGISHGVSLSRYGTKRQSSPRGGNRSSYANSPVGQHNVVDIDRIRAGLDVRTTIMLRNIPNKIDQGLLKSIVDQTSRGFYDFMYLRIDFANNCNVGYAFINFEDPYHIIGFVTARAGQRWNRYSSDKIAEVSYATKKFKKAIQGKDCLVQKFRNSSVMLEHPTFRPKIFITGNDKRAGEEEAFPPPDNASKMRRSVENAEHVGLFAPRAGQHYRDEQRRRRSRYDRGTRLAALEEFDYDEYYSAEQGLQSPYTELPAAGNLDFRYILHVEDVKDFLFRSETGDLIEVFVS